LPIITAGLSEMEGLSAGGGGGASWAWIGKKPAITKQIQAMKILCL